jgi:YidC/Oxa1 family membrane protein insertase
MVGLMPELNRIKIKYYGDGDTIAEEQHTLYKREKYHPLASIIPTLIQIILLMALIQIINGNLGESALTLIPIEAKGLSLLMPIAAGLSAFILSIVQDRINPLQKEQSRLSQIMTMSISVGISLFLGAFVSIGVGLYWICSNLFTIFQQLFLNAVIPPYKYINYKELEESKKALEEINALGAGQKKWFKKDPYRRREKEDYKRFFSIANKHLVFYSEKSGFYKYFENIIIELIRRSNITIHYVTSDPNDQIFDIAKKQPRIKPYYIGEKRLITLMMKMDADMVVMTMPDLNQFHYKRSYIRKDIEYVYIFHYPLSTHMVLRKGALDYYDTIFCVGDFQFNEIRETEKLYNLPQKNLVSVGYGQLEKLYDSYSKMQSVKREHKKVLIAPSWQPDNILDSCIDELLTALLGKGYQVVVRPHPEYVKRYGSKMDAIVKRYSDYQGGDLSFELDFTSNTSIFDSDVVITDWSGTAYEFSFVTKKPSIFINTPPKINNPDYIKLSMEPLEISLRDKIGIQVETKNLSNMAEVIDKLIQSKDVYSRDITSIVERYIANFGKSGEVGSKYIISRLVEKGSKKSYVG